MPETAQALVQSLSNAEIETDSKSASTLAKVVVLTGSMTPARFETSDAEFNIGCVVGTLLSQTCGIFIAMNGLVFPGDQVRKNRDAGRFEMSFWHERNELD